MSTVTNSTIIRRPIADVFAVLTDVEKTNLWFPGTFEEHWTSPPPHGLGSTRRVVSTLLGRRSENEAVVTEFDPPHRAALRGITPNAPFVATLDFESVGDATRVRVTNEIMFGGAARIFSPLVAAIVRLAWRRGLANAKRKLESGQL